MFSCFRDQLLSSSLLPMFLCVYFLVTSTLMRLNLVMERFPFEDFLSGYFQIFQFRRVLPGTGAIYQS